MGHNQVDLLPPDQLHQPIQTFPGEGHAADRVIDLVDDGPTVALAISTQGVKLLADGLFVGRDSGVEGDFHYMDTTQTVTNRKPVSFKNCPVVERFFLGGCLRGDQITPLFEHGRFLQHYDKTWGSFEFTSQIIGRNEEHYDDR